MSLDLSTTLGALGVVLTVVFFAIGYRQTIGARKERARAANKGITDAFLRRIALDPEFIMDRTAIEKLLGGWAIDSRIRSIDMMSASDLEKVVLSRVIESDYIVANQRQEIIQRLERCFQHTDQKEKPSKIAPARFRIRPETTLGAISAIAGLGVSLTVIPIFAKNTAETLSDSSLFFEVAGATVSVAVTALVLTLYTRARDSLKSTSDLSSERLIAAPTFETKIFSELSRIFPVSSIKPGRLFDFEINNEGDRILVETLSNLARMPRGLAMRMAERLKKEAVKEQAKAFLIIGDKQYPDLPTMGLSFDPVRVVLIKDLATSLKSDV